MVVNIIKGGGKVKKNVREKKERRGLASSHEHTRSYSSRETICTTNFASGSFHFYYFNTNKPNYHQQLTKYKYTRTHQEWREERMYLEPYLISTNHDHDDRDDDG